MDSFHDARARLFENVARLPTGQCRIEQAVGRVLREDIAADRMVPAFDRVMMDGHALRWCDWESGCRTFKVTGTTAPEYSTTLKVTSQGVPQGTVVVIK